MRIRPAVAVAILALAVDCPAAFGQSAPGLTMGPQAAAGFVYQGKPLHPFCVEFPADEDNAENRLADCTHTQAAPRTDARGFLAAEDENQAHAMIRRPFSSYRVLGRKGDRFLIATETSGGGTGIFDSLLWVRLDESAVRMAGSIAGGDRCSGGLDGFTILGGVVEFSEHLTPEDVLALAAVRVEQDSVEYSAMSCFARAHYIYDAAAETLALKSVTLRYELGTPDRDGRAEDREGWTGLFPAQSCFNKVFNEHIEQERATLDRTLLQQFGKEFISRCGSLTTAPHKESSGRLPGPSAFHGSSAR